MKIEEINETVVDFAIIEKSEEKNEFCYGKKRQTKTIFKSSIFQENGEKSYVFISIRTYFYTFKYIFYIKTRLQESSIFYCLKQYTHCFQARVKFADHFA